MALRKDKLTAEDRERLEGLMQSPAGHLLGQVLDLDFTLEKGFQMSLGDVDCELFRGLQVLQQERNRHTDEQSKEPPEKKNGTRPPVPDD